jgi:hypothetical protein
VLAALERIGWRVKRQSGSHKLLTRELWPDYEFFFHDNAEIGPPDPVPDCPAYRTANAKISSSRVPAQPFVGPMLFA